jgi:hypothetical protein
MIRRMAKATDRQIQDLARKLVAENPGGIRYSVLIRRVSEQFPEVPPKRIEWSVWNLDSLFPGEIAKPSRGLFTPAMAAGEASSPFTVIEKEEQVAVTSGKIKESDFYEPVADLLRNDLGEVVEVVELGGAGLKSKWATPDVVGTYKPLAKYHIKFDIEIASAEVKIDPQAPVVAFGQAAAYRLFSTKTYIAMPKTMTEEDKGRLESLCMLFGVGLVLFDLSKDDPRFEIRMRAQRFSPDMFYVNEFAERLKVHDPDKFQKLFG